jgi:SAM-dependent methyltransferase
MQKQFTLKNRLHALKSRLVSKSKINAQEQNFRIELKKFRELDTLSRFSLRDEDLFPCLNEATANTDFDHHYIYHPAWAARLVKNLNPVKHIDISSSLSFCSILSAFIQTGFYDFRPAQLSLSNLTLGHADLTNLHFESNSIESISCMHTIEHIGLGRYGDPIDPNGDIKAINELKRVTAPNGSLLLVTPVGKPRIQFNAHRIYSFEMIIELFQNF